MNMNMSGHCPKCGSQLPEEFAIGTSAFCESCDWSDDSLVQKQEKDIEKTTIRTFVGLSVLVLAMHVHLSNWGAYAFTMPVLKAQQALGMLSVAGFDEMIEGCVALAKFECAETALAQMYHKTQDPEAISRLAELQTRQKQFEKAASTYASYYKFGGKNPSVPYQYALILEQTNKLEEAKKYYQLSIEQNPDKLQLQSWSGVVHVLMKQQKFAEARETVHVFHETAENAKGHLEFEMAMIDKAIGPEKLAKGKRAVARR